MRVSPCAPSAYHCSRGLRSIIQSAPSFRAAEKIVINCSGPLLRLMGGDAVRPAGRLCVTGIASRVIMGQPSFHVTGSRKVSRPVL